MRRLKKLIGLLLIFILLSIPVISIGANGNEEKSNILAEVSVSEYSEEYQEWLNLDEETRAKTLAPSMYDIEYKPKLTRGLSASTLPSSYILSNDINIQIKNQRETNTCWTFATMSAIETNLAKANKGYYDFSERHMDYSTSKTFTNGTNPNGYNKELGDGGTFGMGMSYLTSGRGPILETDMPFENNETPKPLSYINGTNYEVQKKVEDYVTFPTITKGPNFAEDMTDFRNSVKQHIMNYGSISAQVTYDTNRFASFNGTHMNMYCNDSSILGRPNHAVSIVGWDDNYAVTNFKEGVRPSKPGAYIVRGSYGAGTDSAFAEQVGINTYTGYDYISYEDYYVESLLVGVINVEDVDYEYLYQHDVLGANGWLAFAAGTQIPTIYGANVFTKKTSKVETLSEISLSVMQQGTSYEVYVNTANESLDSNKLTKVTGTISNLPTGYNTIEFNSPVSLTGTKFAVVVKCTVPSGYPSVAVEFPTSNATDIWATAKAGANESFISSDGTEWQDLTGSIANANLSIKAFTNDETSENGDISSSKYQIDNTYISKIEPNTTVSNLIGNIVSSYTLKVYNKNNQEITGTALIGTGMKVAVNGKEYILVVKGDVDGSTKIDLNDAIKSLQHRAGGSHPQLQGAYLKAAELTTIGQVTLNDVIKIMRYKATNGTSTL